jgi:hypothetical protein
MRFSTSVVPVLLAAMDHHAAAVGGCSMAAQVAGDAADTTIASKGA